MASDKEQLIFQLKIEENRALKKLKKVKESVNNLDRRTKKYKNTVREQVALESRLIDIRKQRVVANKQMEGSVKKLTKAQLQKTDATGSATSATMELSRVISDAPYGIRGMANNITQLVSQLGTASTKAGGLTGALKLMGKQLMGPLGVVFAITVAISALDFFFGANKKAEGSTEDLSASISDNASKLLILSQVMQSSATSMRDKEQIVNDVNSEFKGLNLSLDENGRLTDASRIALDKLTSSMVKNAKAQAIMEKITKEQSNVVEIELQRTKKISEAGVGAFKGTLEDLEEQKQKYIDRYQKQLDKSNLSEQMKQQSMENYMNTTTMKRFENLKNFREKDLKDAKKKIAQMVSFLTKTNLDTFVYTTEDDGKSNKISPFKTPKELDIDIKNAENAMIQYEKKIEDAKLKEELNSKLRVAQSEYEKRLIREKYEEERLRNQIESERKALKLKMSTEKAVVNQKVDNHTGDLKRATELYIHKTKLDKNLSSKQKEQMIRMAKSQLQIATNQAQQEGTKSISEITEKYTPLFALFEKLGTARMNALYSGFGGESLTADQIKERDAKLLEAKLQTMMEASNAIASFMDAEIQREITKEQNKTNAINNELKERLNNENLSASERKRIQLEISKNDEAMRVKKEKLEKKAFKIQKAANIANALVSTYSGASAAYFNSLANPMNKLLPDGGLVRAKINAGIAAAVGLTNVAMIARQKFQSSSAGAPSAGALGGSGGSSGGNDRSFNFNLAGASRENQLANTLQGRFNQPLQAYVVSRDITNQQQLDEEITSSASFG